MWDDDSPHFELYKRGIIAFAEYTWAGDERSVENLKSAYRQREFSGSLSGEEFAFIDQLEVPVAFWHNALLKGNKRRSLYKMKARPGDAIIDLPDPGAKGEWSRKYAERLEKAAEFSEDCKIIAAKISEMKAGAVRNSYTLKVYEQVNGMVHFTCEALLSLAAYDMAVSAQEESEALDRISQLSSEFSALRSEFEKVYAEVRILEKPGDYILDQDHHNHLANQGLTFDWQFYAEMLFLEKITDL